MTTNYIYPSSAELMVIEREKLPRLTADRPIFEIMPFKNVDAAVMVWDQADRIKGLQQVRGLNGAPNSVDALGISQRFGQPGYYGEYATINETELTMRRRMGSFAEPIDLSDLVMEKQDQLLQRRLDRIEYNGWTLLATGTFAALGREGQTMHTDSYTTQSASAAVIWATHATATPLADLWTVKLKHRGYSVDFGRKAKLYMNQVTWNDFIQNTNANDLGGKRAAGLSSITGVDDVNRILAGDDLPLVEIYDEGYLSDAGVFAPFIPINKAILVGKRSSGVALGQYQYTRNANNPDLAPGPYMRVIDTLDRVIPRNIEVHDGHNGGPVLLYPNAVVVLTV